MAERGVYKSKDVTPLEFATKVGTRDATIVTRAYNRVRFGKEQLSTIELREIDRILNALESTTIGAAK
jgi:hypothetical protein